MSGPCFHPGGTVTGGGRATAIQLLGDLKIKYNHIIRV
jgi:hypothetical protein